MKRFLTLIFVVFSLSALVAQESETREISTFSGVKVQEGIDVYLKKGDRESVRVEVSGTDPSSIITEVAGSYLKIHMREGRYRGVDATVFVTYVALDKLTASSASSIFTDGPLKASSIEISASSAGSIDVSIDAGSATISASSAGDIELNGRAESVFVESSTAGEIDAYDLEADKVEAKASTGGSVKVSVARNLKAHASSGGSIRYRGNPDKSVTNSTTGGSVRKSN